ncbi:hypothetical protein EDC14_100860 [Hydrogenispora ethanolica]|jgi:cell division protein FtsX|uniref:Uncharacterized protein n=1 Tax=Hydrogenispora ethanolica TaxID=1082276 RepID=A0A4R1RW60_HYDET|nr:hypothetical protein EDC14_100860 [Hydrogenispora ethanolica]
MADLKALFDGIGGWGIGIAFLLFLILVLLVVGFAFWGGW